MSKKPETYYVQRTMEIRVGGGCSDSGSGSDWDIAIQNDGDYVAMGTSFPDGKEHPGAFKLVVPTDFARLIADSLTEMADYIEGGGMTAAEAAEILRLHNEWRRGLNNAEQQDALKIGIAIDVAVAALESKEGE